MAKLNLEGRWWELNEKYVDVGETKKEDSSIKNISEWNDYMYLKHPTRNAYENKGVLARWVELSRLSKVSKFANMNANSRIIEIGSEEGWLLQRISSSKFVVGADISFKALKDSKGKINDCRNKYLVCCDASQLPFKDNSFDAVVCSEALEHMFNPEIAVAEMSRIGAESAHFIISVPHEHFLDFSKKIINTLGLTGLILPGLEEEQSEWHVQSFTPHSIKKIISAHAKITSFNMVPVPFFGPKIVLTAVKRR